MPSINRRKGQSEAGFTLIEALAALAVLAIALVSLLEAYSGGLRLVGATLDYSQARILAHAVAAERAGAVGARPWPASGTSGRFAWSLDVLQPQADWAVIASEKGWRLYLVRVSVTWDRRRSLQLDTLRLARSDD
jgi:general secretion pathway protein I